MIERQVCQTTSVNGEAL